MESYQGVKFKYQTRKTNFNYDHRLERLNHWAVLFSQLGLAPLHEKGAYGNHSYRTGNSSFIITKSGMTPTTTVQAEDYCHVVDFDEPKTTFYIEGKAAPSSESFLHHALYQALPNVHSILHGHCAPLNDHANELAIPVTAKFYDYGTQELANSAIELLESTTDFFILRDHGFVALGKNIDKAGKLTLHNFSKLIKLLNKE